MKNTKAKVKKLMSGEKAHFHNFCVQPKNDGYLITGNFKDYIYVASDFELELLSKDLSKLAEEVKNKNKLSAQEKYFYVDGNEVRQDYFRCTKSDLHRIAIGNVFKTEGEAEKNKRRIMEIYEKAWEKHVREEHSFEVVK